MSEYAPLRDAFHDINKLLIDKQQWDADHEARVQDNGIKRMMMESQLQDHALQRKKLELEAKENELKMRPSEVNIHDYVPNNAHTQRMLYDADPNLSMNLAKVFGGETLDRVTGRALGSDGKPIIMPEYEKARKSVAAHALIQGALDPDVMISANLGAIERGIDERKKALSEIANLPVNAQKMGVIRGEIARLNAQKAEHTKMRDDPDTRIGLLQKQLAVANGFASQAVTQGAGPELIKLFLNQQDNITKQIVTWQTHKFDVAKQAGDRNAQRVPESVYAVLRDSNGAVVKTVRGTVGKELKPGRTVAQEWGPEFNGYEWEKGFELSKGNEPKTPSKMTDATEIATSKLLSSAYGRPSADMTTTLIYPEQVFAEKMAQKIFSSMIAELRSKHDKIDWDAVSPTQLKEEAIAKQQDHLNFYYAEQAKKDVIVNLIKNAKNMTVQEKQAKLKSELEIYEKNMVELDTMMQKEYNGIPDPIFNPWIPGSETYNKAQKEKRGM